MSGARDLGDSMSMRVAAAVVALAVSVPLGVAVPSADASSARSRRPVPAPAVDLGTLGGSTSNALEINDAGQITGNSALSSGESRGFRWQDGVMTGLTDPSGAGVRAVGVNAA